jgi:gluconolactonase
VYFTDQPNNTIWRCGIDGRLAIFLSPAGRANGLYFDRQGRLLACADEHNQLWAISPTDRRVTVLLRDVGGRRLNGPNDLWVHPRTGNIYFTDPYYQRDYWTRTAPEQPGQYLYLLRPGQNEPLTIETQLQKPNGIVGTPDGRTLYVADAEGNKTYRYRIGSDGRLRERQLFVAQGSDGMTLDEQGNVYLTGQGVTVFSPAGRQIGHIAVPAGWTANVCFGGPDRRTLFITASEAVYTLRMRVRGAG